MQIVCIGLNSSKGALIDDIVKKYDLALDFFDAFPGNIDSVSLSGSDGIILRDYYIHDKGMNLCQVFRLNIDTYLTPIFLAPDSHLPHPETFPVLSLDQLGTRGTISDEVCQWISSIKQRKETTNSFTEKGTLKESSILELLSSINAKRRSGTLHIVMDSGDREGAIQFMGGRVVGAKSRKLEGEEAFVDIITWGIRGTYQFSDRISSLSQEIHASFKDLLEKAFKLIKDASILWSLIPNNSIILKKTDSEAALADKAEDFFCEKEKTYNLINGHRTVSNIVEESQLSCPRTLSFIANLISMGDVEPLCDEVSSEHSSDSGMVKPTSILVVDDSKFVGKTLRKIFEKEPEFQVVGQAYNGLEAIEMIPRLNPDVITLDVEMPKMDGLTALKHIMIKFPRPVVMISTLTREGSRPAFEALRYGAVDVIAKPSQVSEEDILSQEEKIRNTVKKAARVSVEALHFVRPKTGITSSLENLNELTQSELKKVLAIGTGIGGYNVLLQLIPLLPPDLPLAYLVMTWMDEKYLKAFSSYLQQNTEINIDIPESGKELKAGNCYIATRGNYVTVSTNRDGKYQISIDSPSFTKEVTNSLDMMFTSVAETFANNAIGIVLSGSGDDGIQGLEYITRSGGTAFVQKPESCLEQELPTKVIKSVNKVKIVTLKEIPEFLEKICNSSGAS